MSVEREMLPHRPRSVSASFSGLRLAMLVFGLAAMLVVNGGLEPPAGAGRARAAAYGCRDPYPATRDPSNPLTLSAAPGRDPLNGARFFVDGPAHGEAAGGIASLLGFRVDMFSDGYSWPQFNERLGRGRLRRRLLRHGGLAWRVRMLEKIAVQPEAQRVSANAFAPDRNGVWELATKIFCHNLTADPGSIPIISTYFLHPDVGGNCSSRSQIRAARPRFEGNVNEIAAATGRRPVVYLLELDGIGCSLCMAQRGDLRDYLALFRYEVDRLGSLPHGVVYAEAGYSDGNSPAYTARALNQIGVRRIRGFFTNDTHENWTINEIRWAEKVSRLTHGADFIVDTAENGRGPKRNPHPRTQGTNDLCNPPGRGLGPRLNTHTPFAHVDALMWTHVPGNSSGSCKGGPPSGTFWPARAIGLAARANEKLGPGWPSHPY